MGGGGVYGKHLKEFRKNSGLSQEQLGEKIYVSRSAISKIESGEQEVSVQTFKEWAIATNSEFQAACIMFGTDLIINASQLMTVVPMLINWI